MNVVARFVLITLITSALVSCHESKHHSEKTVFGVSKPWRQDVVIELEYVAQIRAIQHIDVRAIEKGYLQTIFVDEGQSVKKGDKLFQIMPNLMQAEYEKARAEYEVAKIQFENTENLYKKKVVSKNELALKRADFSRREAVLNLAKTHLDFTTISAPFDGIVDRFRVRLGSLLEEGELLTTLSDISQLWVYFNVSERDYLNYMKTKKDAGRGDTVRLRLANGELFEHPGIIETIEADFDSETGNLPFRATFPNPDKLLRHGETGNVIITEKLSNALVVPQKAVFNVLDKRFVFVVDKDGKVAQREVFVQSEVPHMFVIESGVTEQDNVLLEGLGKVSNDMTIKTKTVEVAEVKKSFELEAH